MSLTANTRVRDAFEQFFPGLLAKVSALDGEFIEDRLHVPSFTPRSAPFIRADICFLFKFADNAALRIEVSLKQHAANWEIFTWSYHYGPDYRDVSDTHFRIDHNTQDPLHCHIRGHGNNYKKGSHIKPNEVNIEIGRIDPFAFVDMVVEFRRSGVPPLRKVS